MEGANVLLAQMMSAICCCLICLFVVYTLYNKFIGSSIIGKVGSGISTVTGGIGKGLKKIKI